MTRVLAFSFSLIIVFGNCIAAERSGRSDSERMFQKIWAFIEQCKAENEVRAQRIEAQTGEIVPLDYQYFVTPTAEQQTLHEKCLRGALPERTGHKHMEAFIDDIARVSRNLLAAEETASESWEQEPKVFGDAVAQQVGVDERTAELYGLEVTSTNLAVILDDSPSMREWLPALRTEITSNFPNAWFLEMSGCFIYDFSAKTYGEIPDAQFWFIEPTTTDNPFLPAFWISPPPEGRVYNMLGWARRDTISAIRAMIEVRGADSIYWFCDFDDEIDDAAVVELGRLLHANGTRLYIHTMARNPPSSLRKVLEITGGDWVRHRLR